MTRVYGKPFKKGQSGNPGGRAKVPSELREARKMNQIELERIINRQLNLTPKELTAEIKSGELTNKEMLMAMIISKAIVHGDHHRFNFILERIIGKVTERVKHEGIEFTAVIEKLNGDKCLLSSENKEPEEEEDKD